MSQQAIKIFKLNFDGTFDEIAYENIKDVFTIVNILAIYIQKKKIMYVWIGRNASQALKHHVAQIREKIREEFPDYRIIRNITFEMRSEPFEFFENLKITKEELFQQIEYQEKFVIPVLDKIEEIKDGIEKFIISEDYEKAIETSKRIIKLAQEVKDDALITEYERLILDLTKKNELKKLIEEIESQRIEVEKQYRNYININEFLKGHRLVEDFINKYEKLCDFTLVPSVFELISYEKKIWKREQDKITKELAILETNFILSLKRSEFEEAKEINNRAKSLLSQVINDDIQEKWKELDNKLLKATIQEVIEERLENLIKDSIELKKKFQFEPLKERIDALINLMEEENILEQKEALVSLRQEIVTAEEEFKKTNKKINELIQKIERNQKDDLLEENIEKYEEIITLAKAVDKIELIEQYAKILENNKKEIKERKEFEENQSRLREALIKLENDFNSSLNKMEIEKLEDILKKSEDFLSNLVDTEVKKKWEEFNNKLPAAKELIENIEKLSEKGIDALNKGSCPESLESFEKIIYQLQEYIS